MSEAVTGEPQQSANSPARQLLAALTRASQDMEKHVNESYDYVAKLNADLERVVSAQFDETSDEVEQIVRGHIDGISAEKDSIVLQLTELRQEELKVLQSTGRSLRMALVEKLDTLVAAFRKDIDSYLKEFQDKLEDSETEYSSSIERSRQSLRDRIPEFLSALREEISKEKTGLEELHSNYQQLISNESNVSLNELVEHGAELKGRLEAEGEELLAAVDASAQKLNEEQTEQLALRIQSFSLMGERAAERINSLSHEDIKYIKELPDNFNESCSEMAQLQLGLHATVVKNLALQYRTEILSAAQEAEDQVQLIRNELQALLRHYQNYYSEQFEGLLSKFEKSAGDLASAQGAAPDQSENYEQVMKSITEQFAVIKKSVSDNTKEKVSLTENAMEKSYDEFRQRLESSRKSAAEKIESGFRETQDELSKLQQANEEQLNELSQKLEELEQAVTEAKELIRALDQASLDF